MVGHAAQDELVRQDIDDVARSELSINPGGQAFPGELVDQIEHAELPLVVGPALDEVVGRDMVRPLWPQTDAGPIVEPEPTSPGLLLRNLQPLPPPDALHPLRVHHPADIPKQGRDPSVAVAPALRGKRDDLCGLRVSISPPTWQFSLCRAMLTEHATRGGELLSDVVDAATAAGGDHQFRWRGFP